MSELQKDLDNINDIGITFNNLTEGKADPVNFLLKSRNLYEMIEVETAKPFKSNFLFIRNILKEYIE